MKTIMPTVHPEKLHGPTGFADDNIARAGAAKRTPELKVHDAMHSRLRDGTLVVGQTHTAALDDGKLSSDPTNPGKSHVGKLVPASPGMRSRTQRHEVAPDEPGAHANVGRTSAGDLHAQRASNANEMLSNAMQSGGKVFGR